MKLMRSMSADIYENLAIEKQLSHVCDDPVVFLWVNSPSVVLGRHQILWDQVHLQASLGHGVKLARRLSGGGAVYHDFGNLNVSFIGFKNKDESANHMLEILKTLGINAKLGNRGELTLPEGKFSGSAYIKHKNNLVHHLTLLVNADLENVWTYLKRSQPSTASKAVDSVRQGVTNLCDHRPDLNIEAVIKAFESYFGCDCKSPMALIDQDDFIEDQQVLRTWKWIYGHSPAFKVRHGPLLVSVEKGCVTHVYDTHHETAIGYMGDHYKPELFEALIKNNLQGGI